MALRVLYVLSTLSANSGADKHAVNLFLDMPSSEISADFLIVHKTDDQQLSSSLLDRGCMIFTLPPLRRLPAVLHCLNGILTKRNYDVVHCHVPAVGAFVLSLSKRKGVPVRILNVHATEQSERLYKSMIISLFIKTSCVLSTERIAVSQYAGKCAYGGRPFRIVHAAVNLERYAYDPNIRVRVRKALGVDETTLVVGTVGRIVHQKNPLFMAEIAAALVDRCPACRVLWIGDGNMRLDAEAKLTSLGVFNRVLFLGGVDAAEYYQGMDAFVLPSLYEGLPAAGIEAQACGLPVIASDTVSSEFAITDLVHFCSLRQPAKAWADSIIDALRDERRDRIKELEEAGYGCAAAAAGLLRLYHAAARQAGEEEARV